MEQDTIVAIATPLGEAGLGAIRLSGPASLSILKEIFTPSIKQELISHYLCHGWVGEEGRRLDEAMAAYFQAPHSYTGEDVVEIFTHGGPAILKLLLGLVVSKGARLADKGEFTRRAFLNGKIDLTQAEAVVSLVKAKTKEAVYVSEFLLEGRLAKKIKSFRGELVLLLATLEADLDFSEDLPPLDFNVITAKTKNIIKELKALLATAANREIMFEGATVSIIGKPNVGKSSLLNALLKEDKAIVTEVPGTTRDPVEGLLDIKGLLLKMVDTAGMRETADLVERVGVEKAKKATQKAALILLVIDGSAELTAEDRRLLEDAGPAKTLVVFNKADLVPQDSQPTMRLDLRFQSVLVSALTGQGIDKLEQSIYNWFCSSCNLSLDAGLMLITERQQEALARALGALERVGQGAGAKAQTVLLAMDIKDAIVCLGEVTGEEVSDEVLDRIFADFCVGK